MENLSLAEFTREMKLDADQQQCLVPIVAKLLRQMVGYRHCRRHLISTGHELQDSPFSNRFFGAPVL